MTARIMALEVLRTTREVLERNGDEWGLCGSMAAVIAALEADIAAPQEPAVNAELSDDDIADLYFNFGCHLHTPGTTKQHNALIAFARAAIAKATS